MYFGVDYHPEQWVYPYGGNADNPEAAWERGVDLMLQAGVNVVRMGEFTWGICEPEEDAYEFEWFKRVMDIMEKAGIKVVLATPTSAPPIWLAKKYPEILPVDECGLVKHEGTRRAVCLNSDKYWTYSKKIVEKLARTFGGHPQLIAWQIDNALGGHYTEASFNEDTRRDWHGWLEAKYEHDRVPPARQPPARECDHAEDPGGVLPWPWRRALGASRRRGARHGAGRAVPARRRPCRALADVPRSARPRAARPGERHRRREGAGAAVPAHQLHVQHRHAAVFHADLGAPGRG